MSALKQKITELVLSATVDKAGKASFEDAEFVKSLIKDTLAGWKQDASLSLAENLKAMGFQQVKDVLLCYVDTDGQMTAHGYGVDPPARKRVMDGKDVKW